MTTATLPITAKARRRLEIYNRLSGQHLTMAEVVAAERTLLQPGETFSGQDLERILKHDIKNLIDQNTCERCGRFFRDPDFMNLNPTGKWWVHRQPCTPEEEIS